MPLIILSILSGILILATALEFIPLPFWWIRIFDFPHFQIWWLGLIVLVAGLFLRNSLSNIHYILGVLLLASVVYKSVRIFPYTFFAPKRASSCPSCSPENTVSLLIVNVLMDNRKHEKLDEQIAEKNPDILILLEPDKWWERTMEPLFGERFPYSISQPLDNTYGMIIYSALPLEQEEIMNLTEEKIPSMKTVVRLRNGKKIMLYSVHPLPPAPKQDTEDRDDELLTIAKMVKEDELPAIVAGDLNDVAWSRTTTLFLQESQMLDPRLGRGYYNSFHAKIPFLRYPLDHVFFSKEFQLVNMERGKAFGSDHFPIYIKVSLEPEMAGKHQLPEKPEGEEKEEIEEIRQQNQQL